MSDGPLTQAAVDASNAGGYVDGKLPAWAMNLTGQHAATSGNINDHWGLSYSPAALGGDVVSGEGESWNSVHTDPNAAAYYKQKLPGGSGGKDYYQNYDTTGNKVGAPHFEDSGSSAFFGDSGKYIAAIAAAAMMQPELLALLGPSEATLAAAAEFGGAGLGLGATEAGATALTAAAAGGLSNGAMLSKAALDGTTAFGANSATGQALYDVGAYSGAGAAGSAATPLAGNGVGTAWQQAQAAYTAAQPYVKGYNAIKAVASGNPVGAALSYIPNVDMGLGSFGNNMANQAARTTIMGGDPTQGLVNGATSAALGYGLNTVGAELPADARDAISTASKYMPLAQSLVAASNGKLTIQQALSMVKKYTPVGTT